MHRPGDAAESSLLPLSSLLSSSFSQQKQQQAEDNNNNNSVESLTIRMQQQPQQQQVVGVSPQRKRAASALPFQLLVLLFLCFAYTAQPTWLGMFVAPSNHHGREGWVPDHATEPATARRALTTPWSLSSSLHGTDSLDRTHNNNQDNSWPIIGRRRRRRSSDDQQPPMIASSMQHSSVSDHPPLRRRRPETTNATTTTTSVVTHRTNSSSGCSSSSSIFGNASLGCWKQWVESRRKEVLAWRDLVLVRHKSLET